MPKRQHSRFAPGCRWQTRITLLMRQRPGVGCTAQMRWICHRIGSEIWTSARGGTEPPWKTRPVAHQKAEKCVRNTRAWPPQSDAQLREIIANYYGMISLVDHQVGRILSALDDAGLADNTLVVFTSDHGELLGDHGLMLKGPMHYEGLLRVGLIMRGPGIAAHQENDQPVSTLDLAATFGDYAATPVPSAVHSQSLRPLLCGVGKAERDHAYNEWRLGPSRCGVALDLRTVRTQSAKLTLELASGVGEMYDLSNDPHECVNLFDDPKHRGLREELMQRLMSRPDDIRTPLPEPVGPA
jgi:arylsulfatase A-like enzyme